MEGFKDQLNSTQENGFASQPSLNVTNHSNTSKQNKPKLVNFVGESLDLLKLEEVGSSKPRQNPVTLPVLNNNYSTNENDNHSHFQGKFVKFDKKTNGCPICTSNDGRCKQIDSLILCMEVDGESAPEAVLNRWDYIGVNKTREWFMWGEKGKKSAKPQSRIAKSVSTPHSKDTARPLSPNVIDSIYRGLAKEIGLDEAAKADLVRRGINPDEYLGFSVSKELTTTAIRAYGATAAASFPGADSLGVLRYAGSGYTCPALNKSGQVIGYQIRYFENQAKYTWAGTNNKIEVNDAPELPINLAIANSESKTLYLAEGLLKPLVASSKLGINVLGAAGGNLAASKQQLIENISGYSEFIWAVDAGAVSNPRILRQYVKAAELIKEATGVEPRYLWYGQTSKADGKDIDELTPGELAKAKLLTLKEFIEIIETTSNREVLGVDLHNDPIISSGCSGEADRLRLVLTNCKDTYQKAIAEGSSFIYVPKFTKGLVTDALWKINLAQYSNGGEIEVICRGGDDFSPWLDPTGRAPQTLRLLNSWLNKLLGINPIGDTRNELQFKQYLGVVETDDPFYADLEQLHTSTRGRTEYIFRKVPEAGFSTVLHTSKGVLPLATVAYFGSHVPLQNAQRSTAGRYLPDFDVLNDELNYFGAVHGWKCSKGSGKTYQLSRVIKQREEVYGFEHQVTVFTPTRQLNQIIANQIPGMESLNDFKGIGLTPEQEQTIAKMPKLSLCLNSAGGLKSRKYSEVSIIILEELQTILSGWLSPDSHYEKQKLSAIRSELKRALKETVDNGGLVICTDADLTDVALERLCDFAEISRAKIVKVNHEREDVGFECTVYDKKNQLIARMIRAIASKKPIAIFSDSKRLLQQVEILISKDEELRKKAFFLTADTAASDEFKGFPINPDGWLTERTPTIFGYTSVIGAGVDINYKDFEEIFIFAHGVLAPDQIRQGSLRFRNQSIPRHAWIADSRLGGEEILNYRPTDIRAEIQESVLDTLASVGISTTPEVAQLLSAANPLLDLRALDLAKQQYQSFGYKAAILGGFAIAQNCSLLTGTSLTTANLKDAEEELIKRDSQLIVEAIALPKNSPQFLKLDQQAYKTYAEWAQWIKSVAADSMPGLDLGDVDFAKQHLATTRGRNNLKKLRGLSDATFSGISSALVKCKLQQRIDEMLTNEKDALLFTEVKRYPRRNAALARLGLSAVLYEVVAIALDKAKSDAAFPNSDPLGSPVLVDLNTPAIRFFLEKFTKDLGKNKKALGLKFDGYLNRFEKFKRILRLVGLSVKKPSQGSTDEVLVTLPYKFLNILIAYREKLLIVHKEMANPEDFPTGNARDDSDLQVVKSLLDKLSELTSAEIDQLKDALKVLFGLTSTNHPNQGQPTTVITSKSPPQKPPG